MKSHYVYDEKRIIIISMVLCIFNAYTFTLKPIALIISVLENLLVLFCLLRQKFEDFLSLYLIFSSCAIESGLFTTGDRNLEFFSFINLPFIHYYHLFFFMLLAYILNLYSAKKFKIIKNEDAIKYVLIFIIGLIGTLLSFLMNDNLVFSTDGMLRFVIIDCYNSLWLCCLMALTDDLLNQNRIFGEKLKKLILGILEGVSVASIILAILHRVNVYGEGAVFLICPIILFFAPGLILLWKEKQGGGRFFVLGILSMIVQVKYPVGIPGAWWVYIAFVCVLFSLQIVAEVKNKLRVTIKDGTIVLASIFCAFLLILLIPQYLSDGSYLAYKLNTFMNLISLGNMESWYLSLGNSIGVRVDAIANCIVELITKPIYLIFGKGYGGSIRHLFGAYNWDLYGSTYPDVQINSGVYSSFHTGIAELIINFGIVGIAIIVKCCACLFKVLIKDKWNCYLYIGVFWLFVFIYFYHSMFLCSSMLCYGLWISKEHGIKCLDENKL